MLFRQMFGPASITTMVERMSRFLVALKNPKKCAKPIMAQSISALTPLPRTARRSVTFDLGTEFINCSTCRPDRAQAGSAIVMGEKAVENKRLRRCASRDTNPETLSQNKLRQFCAALNSTPQK